MRWAGLCRSEGPQGKSSGKRGIPQFRHSGFPIPELSCLELTLLDLLRQFDSANSYDRVVESFESQHRPNPLFDSAVVLLNGLITNDKFCISRVSRQKLRYARRPRTLPCKAVDSYAYPRDEEHRGGANEATVESSSSVSADHECRAAVGPGLPTSPAMDPTDRPGPRSSGFVSPSSGSRGEI
jgi:hypothetical protein